MKLTRLTFHSFPNRNKYFQRNWLHKDKTAGGWGNDSKVLAMQTKDLSLAPGIHRKAQTKTLGMMACIYNPNAGETKTTITELKG